MSERMSDKRLAEIFDLLMRPWWYPKKLVKELAQAVEAERKRVSLLVKLLGMISCGQKDCCGIHIKQSATQHRCGQCAVIRFQIMESRLDKEKIE